MFFPRKHHVNVYVPVEKHSLFGKKTVMEKRSIQVNEQDYRKLKRKHNQDEDDFLMLCETF